MTELINGFRVYENAAENKKVLRAGHCTKKRLLNAKTVVNKLKMVANNALSEVASRDLHQGSTTPDTDSETGV